MKRREFVAGLGAASVANVTWLRAANSQQRKIPHVGIIDEPPGRDTVEVLRIGDPDELRTPGGFFCAAG
jgi:hypothetical protein